MVSSSRLSSHPSQRSPQSQGFADAKVDADIASIAECCICFEKYTRIYRQPISLFCGHTFCKNCVRRMITADRFFCALCRIQNIVVVDSMEKNIALSLILEKFKLFDSDEGLKEEPLGTAPLRPIWYDSSPDTFTFYRSLGHRTSGTTSTSDTLPMTPPRVPWADINNNEDSSAPTESVPTNHTRRRPRPSARHAPTPPNLAPAPTLRRPSPTSDMAYSPRPYRISNMNPTAVASTPTTPLSRRQSTITTFIANPTAPSTATAAAPTSSLPRRGTTSTSRNATDAFDWYRAGPSDDNAQFRRRPYIFEDDSTVSPPPSPHTAWQRVINRHRSASIDDYPTDSSSSTAPDSSFRRSQYTRRLSQLGFDSTDPSVAAVFDSVMRWAENRHRHATRNDYPTTSYVSPPVSSDRRSQYRRRPVDEDSPSPDLLAQYRRRPVAPVAPSSPEHRFRRRPAFTIYNDDLIARPAPPISPPPGLYSRHRRHVPHAMEAYSNDSPTSIPRNPPTAAYRQNASPPPNAHDISDEDLATMVRILLETHSP